MSILNPWAAAAHIADVFGVESSVLKEGAQWAGKWAATTNKAQQATNKAISLLDTGISSTSQAAALLAKQKQNYNKNQQDLDKLKAAQAKLNAYQTRNRATTITQQKTALVRLQNKINNQTNIPTVQKQQQQRVVQTAITATQKQEDLEMRARLELMAKEREMKQAIRDAEEQQIVQNAQMKSDAQFQKQVDIYNVQVMQAQRGIGGVRKTISNFGGVTMSENLANPYIRKVPKMNAAKYKNLESIMKNMVRFAKRQSSGPYSLKQLAAMDHPYAKRHKMSTKRMNAKLSRINPVPGTVARDVINTQSGRLKNAWFGGLEINRDGVELELGNSVPYAKYLADGTQNMLSHGPWQAAFKQFQPQIDSEWNKVSLDAQKQYLLLMSREQAATRKGKNVGVNFS